jgi:hypothetical protein
MMDKIRSDFSIVASMRGQIPGRHGVIEELVAQLWSGGAIKRQCCRLFLPAGLQFSEEEWKDSPFCCFAAAWELGGGSRAGLLTGDKIGFRRCLQSCVVCWPDLRSTLDLLSRAAGWLPDADCSAWEFQDLWRAAMPSRKRERVKLPEVAARMGASLREPAKTDQIASLLGEAVSFLDQHWGLEPLQLLAAGRGEVDFECYGFSPEWLDVIPQQPGIYWMLDREGKTFYVGKSKNLYQRVRSYFIPPRAWDEKLRRIHERLYKIEFCCLGSELEAFLEEARAIERWKPEVNFQMEVQERQSEYYRDCDLILVLPSDKRAAVRLFFVRGGRFGGDFHYSGRKDQRKKLISKIENLFFAKALPEKRWETHVLQSFLRQNLEHTNHIDVRQATGSEQCMEWIERFRKMEGAERVVFHR